MVTDLRFAVRQLLKSFSGPETKMTDRSHCPAERGSFTSTPEKACNLKDYLYGGARESCQHDQSSLRRSGAGRDYAKSRSSGGDAFAGRI